MQQQQHTTKTFQQRRNQPGHGDNRGTGRHCHQKRCQCRHSTINYSQTVFWWIIYLVFVQDSSKKWKELPKQLNRNTADVEWRAGGDGVDRSRKMGNGQTASLRAKWCFNSYLVFRWYIVFPWHFVICGYGFIKSLREASEIWGLNIFSISIDANYPVFFHMRESGQLNEIKTIFQGTSFFKRADGRAVYSGLCSTGAEQKLETARPRLVYFSAVDWLFCWLKDWELNHLGAPNIHKVTVPSQPPATDNSSST